jgi:hypothetical protein
VKKQFISSCVLILAATFSVLAQGTANQESSNRLIELLRHPTFITLRLVCQSKAGEFTDAPPPYKEKEFINCQLFITQNSSEQITMWNELNLYYEYRVDLVRDGDAVSYIKEAKKGIEIAEKRPPSGSSAPLVMEPGREYSLRNINLKEWYGLLSPGRYQLTLRRRFVWDGDWVQSNPVIFQIEPRKPESIPETVTVRLAPLVSQPLISPDRLRLDSDVRVKVFVINNSDRRVKVNVVDLYYGDRLQLFRDNVLVPYREETAKLIRSKDETAQPIDTATEDFFLDPNTTSDLRELRLSDWYGPLTPGSYRLTNRCRFEVDGPWTRDSAPLVFEIVKK